MSLGTYLFALRYHGMFLSRETFTDLFLRGWVVDARAGGLVIGRRHLEGNIYMIQQEGERFAFYSHLEGGEYIVNHRACEKFMARIEAINADQRPIQHLASGPPVHRMLNTIAAPFDKVLFIDVRGQFVVNRYATARHLEELERMNESENDFLHCDLDTLVAKSSL